MRVFVILTIMIWMGAEPVRGQQEAYIEEAVSFFNDPDSVRLQGILTLPKEPGTYPLLVLAGGTTLQDRVGTYRGHHFFRFVADHLTRSGIGVFSYDQRGVGESTGSFFLADLEAHARDLASAVEFVSGHPSVDADRIGILGHAEGGILAAMYPEVEFMVWISTPGVKGADLQKRRLEMVGNDQPDTTGYLAATFSILEEAAEMSEPTTPVKREERMLNFIQGAYDTLPEEVQQHRKINVLSQWQLAAFLSTPSMQFLLDYDPYYTFRRVDCPVLVLAGSKDQQVDPAQNLPRIRRALSRGDNLQSTIIELPGLNHFLQPTASGLEEEIEAIPVTIDPGAMRIITEWVQQQVRRF